MDRQEMSALLPPLGGYLREFVDCFVRSEPLEHLSAYVSGQLSDLRRKSIAPMAELAGMPPRTLQHFLSRHVWDEELMLDILQQIVAREYQHPRSIGIIQERCHLKKGDNTPGVCREWCNTTSRPQNCIATVHLGYAAGDFHCLLDGELFLPESWADDRRRCRSAGIADEMLYRTKWQIAFDMYQRAVANGMRIQWLTFDERYGQSREFLAQLDDRGQRYVAEVPRTFTGWLIAPKSLRKGRYQSMAWPRRHRRPRPKSTTPECIENLCRRSDQVQERPWKTARIEDGSTRRIVWQAKAARFYFEHHGSGISPHLLIFARDPGTPTEIRYFVSNAKEGTSLQMLLAVTFRGQRMERCLGDEMNQLGLSHFEVRNYLSLRRHLILTAVSHLFLAKVHHMSRGETRL